MNIAALIDKAVNKGINLYLKEGRLAVNAPEGVFQGDIKDEIIKYKEQIIEILKSYEISETYKTSIKKDLSLDLNNILLSYSQQRLWLINQLDPSSAQYNMPAALQLSGHLNITALTHAFTTIIQRHESLRTVFTKQNEVPIQQIQPADTFKIPIVDLSSLEIPEQTRQVQHLSKVEAHKPFDLTADRMLRSQLLKLADNEHILLVTLHHIASDGWSIGILIRELSILYQAYTEGRDNPLPVLNIQYADYAHWQRQYLQGDVLEQQLHYWQQQQLADLPVAHNIPLDYPRPKQQCFNGAVITTQIQPTLVTQLQQLCEQHEATLFMGLHAAFSVLLARYSNQTDIVVGTPIANREQAEVSELIGFFVNTLVLRSDVSDNISFIALLQQSKQTALEAYAHQQVPFEQLVETLQPVRSLSHSPLFQIMLVLQNTQTNNLELPGLTINELAREVTQTKFDLTLNIIENPQGLQLEWEYNTDLFKIDTIERMSGHFHRLLAQLLASPQDSVHSLSMLDDAEHQQLLVEWNDTRADYPDTDCIHERFEQQVEKTPDAIAVVFEDQQLTYRQLNQQANQLAHYLINKRHVTPDTLVGVCLDRSLEMVVSLLAVLKAGGAYVPLDPDYPAVRLEHMLEDAGLETVITCRPVLMRTPVIDDQALCLDDETVQEQLLLQPTVNIDVRLLGLTPDHLVYVVYTSGSTGQPKGVMIKHRGLPNLVQDHVKRFHINKRTHFLHNISISFDAASGGIWMTLAEGACLVIVKDLIMENSSLQQLINTQRISHLMMTPSNLGLLNPEALPSVTCVVVGGDKCPQELADNWNLHCSFFNAYGPAENTVCTTVKEIHHNETINIGKLVQNTQAYVLNNTHMAVPIGIPGELYIGGTGLARGYLNQPELTQEKFIQSPFSNDPSERLYKTGDLVRWLPDGNLEFLGRIDDQIKIRGFRVELGEIEHTLCKHHIVKEAIVIAHTNAVDEKRLVAYVVADTEVETDLLRQYVSKRLPDYMVPSAFILLDEFPLTSNGKVNRQALPEPDFTQSVNEYIAPTTETEKILCEIWQEILGIKTVGVTDDFFHLGGHSLLAVRMIAQVEEILKMKTSVRAVFENTTVKDFSFYLQKNCEIALPIIKPRSEKERVPLSLIQQSYWFLYNLEGKSATYNTPLVISLKGDLNIAILEKSLKKIIARHENLRTRLVNDEHGPKQEIDSVSDWSLPIVSSIKSELTILVEEEINKVIFLEKEAAFRVKLFCAGEQEYILCIISHHTMMDGWSQDILFRELITLYNAFHLSNNGNALPPLTAQYGDYAVWQKKYMTGQYYEKQRNYWKEKLKGLSPLLNLPTDYTRPPAQSYKGNSCKIKLPGSLSKQLRSYSEKNGVTLYHTLLGGIAVLLSRYARTNDIPIGTAIANRPQKVLENIIGCFSNTIVLRCKIENSQSFSNIVQQIKDTALDAFSYADIPFDAVVNTVQPERSLGIPPIFQVMFRLHNQVTNEENKLQNIKIEPFSGFSRKIAELDLNISLLETASGIQGEFTYATDLFREETIERFIDHYINLLTLFMREPEKPVETLSFLLKEEQSQLELWNKTKAKYPEQQCIHTLFEHQALNFPETPAYIFDNQRLTYAELNQKANQLAHWLKQQGIGPEMRVGVCVPRSIWMGICLLAIFKSQGIYVPLDPHYPEDRLTHMLDVTQPDIILSHTTSSKMLNTSSEKIIHLDKLSELDKCNSNNPVHPIDGNHSAYILFTSGSTGKPKGILVSHKSFRNMVLAQESVDLLSEKNRVLQFASLSFSISLWGSFMAWTNGGTLYQITDEQSLADEPLYQLLHDEKITTVTWPVSLLSILPVERVPDSLKTVISSAEPCNDSVVKRWTNRGIRFLNLYGNSEVSLGSTIYEYKEIGDKLTIGKALPNTTMYLLDEYLQQVPIGVIAEIHTGGIGLATAYVNRPDATAEKFIPNPFSETPGERLYKTGDLGRYLPNGEIEFIGREDFQVHIRGFRVELFEIEDILREQKDISDVAVVARSDSQGNDRLVCFYVTIEKTIEDLSIQLRNTLAAKLPAYMIPSLFIPLSEMPLTPNRKVDRLKLPKPDLTLLQEKYVPPNNQLEELLCGSWSEILGIEKVGTTDNFFTLGGHSLLAIQLINEINKKLNTQLAVTNIFTHSTIAELSLLINQTNQYINKNNLPLVALSNSNVTNQAFHLIPGIGGSLMNFYDLSKSLGKMANVYGLQAIGLENDEEPLNSVETIASKNIEAMLQYSPQNIYHLVGHSFGGWVAFEMARQLIKQGCIVGSLTLLDSPAPNIANNQKRQMSSNDIGMQQLDGFIDQMLNDGSFQIDEYFQQRIKKIAHLQASMQYQPEAVLSDITTIYIQANTNSELTEEPKEWQTFFTQSLQVNKIDADHFNMLYGDQAEILSNIIARAIGKNIADEKNIMLEES